MLRALITMLVLGVVLSAQERPATTQTPRTALSEDEQVMVDAVVALQQQANAACQNLEAVQLYNQVRQKVEARVQANHPGQQWNWASRQLTAKPPPAAKVAIP